MRPWDLRSLSALRLRKMTLMMISAIALLTFCMILKLTSSELDDVSNTHPSPKEVRKSEDNKWRQQSQIEQLTEHIERMEKRIVELEASRKSYPTVQFRNVKDRKRILITGGAGFVGSHLTDKLMAEGHEVSLMYRRSGFFLAKRLTSSNIQL